MATKAQLLAELERLGVDYDPTATKAELVELLDELADPDDEITRREAAAPRCVQCGRSRLDGHVHTGV